MESTLGLAINKLSNFNWAKKYKEYLSLRDKGLKKQAQVALKSFFVIFCEQDKNSKRRFIDSIYSIALDANDFTFYIPVNLHTEIFKPEIEDWIKEEPTNPLPYRWSSDFNLLKKAIDLNPFDQVALDLFFTRLINRISINQHEIEFGFPYDGNPDEDFNLIDEYEKYVENVTNIDRRNDIKKILAEIKEVPKKNIK